MIIKLLEQPIISMYEAEVAGTVDGAIIKGSKVSYIYHRNMEKHFVIPVEKAIFGSDAVMIRDMTAMTLALDNGNSLKSLLDIYNVDGKYLGYLSGIEVDDEFTVSYICTGEYRIKMSKLMNYGSIIIVDIEEAELEKIEAEVPETEKDSASEEEAAVSMEIGPDIKWNDENCQPEEDSIEGSELSVVRTVHQAEEKIDIPGVDAKYTYLCGKQLLEDIDIGETSYEKGTIIDAEMIRQGIENNAIVKIIVNAED